MTCVPSTPPVRVVYAYAQRNCYPSLMPAVTWSGTVRGPFQPPLSQSQSQTTAVQTAFPDAGAQRRREPLRELHGSQLGQPCPTPAVARRERAATVHFLNISDENEPPTAEHVPVKTSAHDMRTVQLEVSRAHTECYPHAGVARELGSTNIPVRLPPPTSDDVGCLSPLVVATGVRRVRFNSELSEAFSITPYSQVYGMHPRFFYFNCEGQQIPLDATVH